MLVIRKICLSICALAVLTFNNHATASRSAASGTDQLIIKYSPDTQRRMSRDAFRTMIVRTVSGVIGSNVAYKRAMAAVTGAHVLTLPQHLSVEQVRAYTDQLRQQFPQIEYAEPDYRRYTQRTVPTDPEFNQQWHLLAPEDFAGAANVVNAWDISKGKPEIVVAVLDDGMTDHADLRPAFVGGTLAASGYDMVAQAEDAGDGDGRDSDPSNPGTVAGGNQSSEWHGTHVGGIIAARPDNDAFIAGVGWNTSLSAVRIVSTAGGYLSDQVDGMLWAAGESVPGAPDNRHPARVLNMSVGSDIAFDCSRTEQNAINMIGARGISIVVAAGNLNKNVVNYAPGNCDGVITVTGVMPDGARASYANYGELVDIAAPGDNIHSTANSGEHVPAADSTRSESGTSQAAPQVSAVIALMLAVNEKLSDPAVVKPADLPALLKDKLKQSVRSFPTAINGSAEVTGCNDNQKIACVCSTTTCGAGLLDAQRALLAVTTAPVAEVGSDRAVAAETAVQLDGSASTDSGPSGKIASYRWEQLSGPEVGLQNTNQRVATFMAPTAAELNRQLHFKLTVTDDVGLQDSAETVVTVLGTDDPVNQGAGGAGSHNGGGGSMTFGWLFALLLGSTFLKRRGVRGI